MGFWGGASGKEKKAYKAASDRAQAGFKETADWATGQRDHVSQFENDIRSRGTDRGDFMWNQLWGEGGAFRGGGGGGGGVPAYRGDPNSIWGQLRDTGDLTGGDWANARETYEDFRTTGGISDADRSALRSRALAGTEIYDPSANARSRVQGGWGAGTAGTDLARQKAIAQLRNQASWGAEADILDRVNQGRQWGATSLEGLGSKVQAGRITGQTKMDAERQRRNAHARAAAAASRAAQADLWNRSMQLMGFDQGRLGQAGADLQYNAAAQAGHGGAFQAADTTMGRNQANQGWGSQLMGMIGQGANAAAGLTGAAAKRAAGGR